MVDTRLRKFEVAEALEAIIACLNDVCFSLSLSLSLLDLSRSPGPSNKVNSDMHRRTKCSRTPGPGRRPHRPLLFLK